MNYHDRSELSATMLKSMAKGWRQFEGEFITRTIERKETPSLKLGSAIHCAILEPDQYEGRYVVCPEECSDRRTKAYKEWAANANALAIVLTPSEGEIVKRASDAFFRNKTAARLLALGDAETEHYWRHPAGADCRAKIDWLVGSQIIFDIKTCDDARPHRFRQSIIDYRYDLQAVHYMEAVQCKQFIFAAVETSAPYRVRLYDLMDWSAVRAAELREKLIGQYVARKASGDWSEPREADVVAVDLPNYLFEESDYV